MQKRFSALVLTVLTLYVAVPANTFARESYAPLVEKTLPAVVNISTTQIEKISNSPYGGMFEQGLPNGHPLSNLPELLERFYGQGQQKNAPTERKSASLGSGFVIHPDGYIVTNYHVIEGADEIRVTFADDKSFDASVLGTDSKTDIALLKIKASKPLPYLQWADSDTAKVGDHVIAIGNPFGLGGSVSAGIISARARNINSGPFDDFIQTDAAINRGNSGGPLLNDSGSVIGINTAIFSPSGGNVGIGFAAPSALAKPVVEQLKTYGKAKRGWLGVKIQNISEDIASALGLSTAEGALVIDVSEGSPADKAGFRSGDVITRFNGEAVEEMRELPRLVAETKAGSVVPVIILRDEKQKKLSVKIAELKEEETAGSSDISSGKKAKNKSVAGMRLVPITPDIRARYRLEDHVEGVVVADIDPSSVAAGQGVLRGDVILSANRKKVASIKDISREVRSSSRAKKPVLLMLLRQGSSLFVAVPTDKE